MTNNRRNSQQGFQLDWDLIERVYSVEYPTFKNLAEAANLDLRKDFQGISLNGVPLAGQDLTGIDFSGSDLRDTQIEGAKVDENTILKGILHSGRNPDPKLIAYNKKLNKARRSDLGKIFNEIIRQNLAPDVITYNTLMNKSPDLETSVAWFHKMEEAGIDADEYTRTILKKLENK